MGPPKLEVRLGLNIKRFEKDSKISEIRRFRKVCAGGHSIAPKTTNANAASASP